EGATGDLPFVIPLTQSEVDLVFTHRPTEICSIVYHGARSTRCGASGSNQSLNSRRGVLMNSGSSVTGFKLAPMNTRSLASLGNSGSMEIASARLVIGPPA